MKLRFVSYQSTEASTSTMDDPDYLFHLKIPVKLIKCAGLWQEKKASLLYKVYGLVLNFIMTGIFTSFMFVFIFTSKNFIDLSEMLSVLATFIVFCYKSINFVKKFGDVMCLLDGMKRLKLLSRQATGDKALEKVSARVKIVKAIFLATWISSLVTTFTSGAGAILGWFLSPRPPFKIAYKMWAPFDYENDVFWFFCIAIYQSVIAMFASSVHVALDTFLVYSFYVGAGLLEELSDRFSRIGQDIKSGNLTNKTDRNCLMELEKCIVMHQEIKLSIGKAQEIFSHGILFQCVISLVVLCTTAFTISTVSENLLLVIMTTKNFFNISAIPVG